MFLQNDKMKRKGKTKWLITMHIKIQSRIPNLSTNVDNYEH